MGYGGNACHLRGHRTYANRPVAGIQAPQNFKGGRAVRARACVEGLFWSGFLPIAASRTFEPQYSNQLTSMQRWFSIGRRVRVANKS